jgi:uncharacterized membrane protein YbhN (UPF0104 family)
VDESFETVEAETSRVIRTGTIWTTAGMLTPAIALGPLVASGWRPSDLPGPAEIIWWIGVAAAAIGLGLLMWAGCPVLGFPLRQAHAQKIFSIRVGIVMNLIGMAVAGMAVLVVAAK